MPVQRDRDLVRLHWPVELRPAFDALFAIDDAMAEVVTSATQPALAAIKLAWWREALEKLDSGPPPGEPRLQAAANDLLTRGVSGADLALLEEGWTLLLQNEDGAEFVRGISLRGLRLFNLAAQLLAIPTDDYVADSSQWFASADLARRGILTLEPNNLGQMPGRSARRARPLTAIAALAWRDRRRGGPPFEAEATPGRAWTLLRHRITGR